MIITKLWLENIFSYPKVEIDFSQTDFALFVGKTGSGKSSIFDGLFWILYEKTARKNYHKKNVLRTIPRKQSYCLGELDFIDGKNKYKVTREYRGKESSLTIIKNGNDISHRTPTMVQGQLEEIIGVDYDTFLNIVYFSQADIGRFLTSDSGKRIEIISDLLKLMVFDQATKVCNGRLNTLEKKSSNYVGQIDTLTQQIEEVDIGGLKKQKRLLESGLKAVYDQIAEISQYLNNVKIKKDWQDKLKTAKREYDNQLVNSKEIVNGIKQQINEVNKKKDDLIKIKKLSEQYAEKMMKYDKVNKQMNELSEKKTKNKNLMIKNETKLESIVGEHNKLKKLLNTDGNCPTCSFPLDGQSKRNMKKIIAGIEINEKDLLVNIQKYEHNIEIIDEKISNLQFVLDKLEDDKVKYTSYKTKESMLIKSVNNISTLKLKYESTKTTQKDKLNRFKEKYNYIKKQYDDFKGYDLNQYDYYNDKYDKYESIIKKSEDEIKAIKLVQADTTRKIKQRGELKKEANELISEINMVVSWKQAFPKIKLYMINNVIPYIQNQTNMSLTQMLPGKRIIFNIEPDRATNRMGITIEDYINRIKRPFEGWSGGQKDEMSLSIFMALNKLASIKSGKSFPFLILDEKFSSIDVETRNIVIDILKEQQKDRKIWVISHVENIDDHFNQVFEATMKKGISKLARVR